MFNKDLKNQAGFTLTEVLIGILILTVAIVAASNLLSTLVKTNRTNVLTLQAYYLAQEGVEAMRNIRDTNWLHNSSFVGSEGGVYEKLQTNNSYAVYLLEQGWESSAFNEADINQLSQYKFWEVDLVSQLAGDSGPDDPYAADFALALTENKFYSHNDFVSDEAVFYRHVDILPYCDDSELPDDRFKEDDCENFILVRSVVNFKDGQKDRSVELEAVLSNWKGGAL